MPQNLESILILAMSCAFIFKGIKIFINQKTDMFANWERFLKPHKIIIKGNKAKIIGASFILAGVSFSLIFFQISPIGHFLFAVATITVVYTLHKS